MLWECLRNVMTKSNIILWERSGNIQIILCEYSWYIQQEHWENNQHQTPHLFNTPTNLFKYINSFIWLLPRAPRQRRFYTQPAYNDKHTNNCQWLFMITFKKYTVGLHHNMKQSINNIMIAVSVHTCYSEPYTVKRLGTIWTVFHIHTQDIFQYDCINDISSKYNNHWNR